MKKLFVITAILLAVLTVVISTAASTDPESDALMALYNSTDGPNWKKNTGWGVGDPCDDSWHGVYCVESHVTLLLLSTNDLAGRIPTKLANLSDLEELSLAYNQLSGPIPPELGTLGSLRALELANNNLSGFIPTELSNLGELRVLVLSGNPGLPCWVTTEARDWALGLPDYYGPHRVCSLSFDFLPIVLTSGN